MITRRNWLLKCSILINVAVLLYICSHMMIGSSNIQLGPAFMIQEDVPKSHLRQQENEIFQTNEKDSSIKTQETSVRFCFFVIFLYFNYFLHFDSPNSKYYLNNQKKMYFNQNLLSHCR